MCVATSAHHTTTVLAYLTQRQSNFIASWNKVAIFRCLSTAYSTLSRVRLRFFFYSAVPFLQAHIAIGKGGRRKNPLMNENAELPTYTI